MEMPVSNANSVDPDQMPRSAASDLGLHYMHIFLLLDARRWWVNCGLYSTACMYSLIWVVRIRSVRVFFLQ